MNNKFNTAAEKDYILGVMEFHVLQFDKSGALTKPVGTLSNQYLLNFRRKELQILSSLSIP